MGAKNFCKTVVAIMFFVGCVCSDVALSAKQKETDMRRATTLEDLKDWAKSAYLGCQFKHFTRGEKEVFVILGDMAFGSYRTEIRAYAKVKDEWVLFFTRSAVGDLVKVAEKGDDLIFSTGSGKVLLILPFEGIEN
jgi:hypothetical protein